MYLHHIVSHRLNIIRKRIFSWHLKDDWRVVCTAFYSKLTDISRENFLPLNSMVEFRRDEARRSVLIEVEENKMNLLHSVCSQFGNIKNAFAFQPTKNKNVCLIEFENEASLAEVLRASQTTGTEFEEHVLLPFLKFSVNKLKNLQKESSSDSYIEFQADPPVIPEEEMTRIMSNCNSISEQIQYIYDSQKMTEIGWRLRFFICRKMEWLLPAVLSNCVVRPFGSCITTFGNRHCDVDMSVEFISKNDKQQQHQGFSLLVQRKRSHSSEDNRPKKSLRLLADLLGLYMPGVEKIQPIMNATVPIIKCHDTLTGLDCDLSIQDSAFHMSELLYLLGCADPRIRPLVFCVKWWAKVSNLTRKSQPWHWFSSFQMTMFVLFFLMNTRPTPVLPSLQTLQIPSRKGNFGHNFFNVEDISRIPSSTNCQTLEELLMDFFKFYIRFNFSQHAISLIAGRAFDKPYYNSLVMQNPLNKQLNVCKNISHEEVEEFKLRCLDALRLLNSSSSNKEQSGVGSSWGLLSLCRSSAIPSPQDDPTLMKFDAESFLHDSQQANSNDALDTMPQYLLLTQNHHGSKRKKKKRNSNKFPNYNF